MHIYPTCANQYGAMLVVQLVSLNPDKYQVHDLNDGLQAWVDGV